MPLEADSGKSVFFPVEVTYDDATTDNITAEVKVDRSNAQDFQPGYEDKQVVPGEETKSTPTFTDKDGKDVEAPEGSKFEISEDFKKPEGYEVEIDENTGEITVTFPDDSKLNKDTVEEFDVPVTVTYPDDTKDDATAKFELDTDGDGTPDTEDTDDDGDGVPDDKEEEDGTNPKAPNQNGEYEPGYEDGSGKPGDDVMVPAPEFKDKDGNPTEAPDGTTFAPGENAPDGVTVDENTGEITVPVPGDANPGDKITVPVEVTYPDKSKDYVDVTVTVEQPDPSVNPGDTTVPADNEEHTVGKVENPKGDETGKLVDKDGNEIPGSKVEIDDDGNVKVTVPEGTDPQDAKVIVTDKEGNPVGEIDVKIVDPSTDAAKFVPDYGDRKNVEAGKTETADPFEGQTDVPVKEATGTPSEGSDAWTFETGKDNGVVTATAPGYDEVEKTIASELPTIDSSWDKFKEIFTPYVRPSVTVEFTYNDGSENAADAGFDLVGKDGKSLLDPDGDFDGDGTTNREEIEGGTNPAEVDSGDQTPDTTAPEVDEIKPGDKEISGKGDRPGEDIIVELPGGKTVETTTDDKGNWTIEVPADVDLQPGQNVTVSDGAGNKTNATVGIDAGKCAATAVGFGLPLLALIPLGLATQMEIPGLSDFVAQANSQVQAANTQIQQQLGLFNPQIAAQVDAVNKQLAQFGTDAATVAGGLALIAAGILAGTILYNLSLIHISEPTDS